MKLDYGVGSTVVVDYCTTMMIGSQRFTFCLLLSVPNWISRPVECMSPSLAELVG